MAPSFCGPKTVLYLIRGAGLLGGFGGGLDTTYKLMWPETFNIRWAIIFFYLCIFCLFIISAELDLLNHPIFKKFGRFMTTFSGRAFFYLFIGGLIMNGSEWYQYIPGVYLCACAILNIVALCCWGNYLDGADSVEDKKGGSAPPDTPSSSMQDLRHARDI